MTARTTRSALAALVFLAAAANAAAGTPPADRHNRLLKAEPAVDGTIAASPSHVRLWFKERPELATSGITLLRVNGADSSAVALGPVTTTDDPTSIAAALASPIKAGRYAVRWRTSGRDGHVIRGTFGFTLK